MPMRPKRSDIKIIARDPSNSDRQELVLDGFETSVLNIARKLFESFEEPESQCWMSAFMEAERVFKAPFGATIAHAITIIISDIWHVRSRNLTYLRASDPMTVSSLTPEERYFMQMLQDMRRQNYAQARMFAMLLCEGGDSDVTLAAVERLCIITGDIKTPKLNAT